MWPGQLSPLGLGFRVLGLGCDRVKDLGRVLIANPASSLGFWVLGFGSICFSIMAQHPN